MRPKYEAEFDHFLLHPSTPNASLPNKWEVWRQQLSPNAQAELAEQPEMQQFLAEVCWLHQQIQSMVPSQSEIPFAAAQEISAESAQVADLIAWAESPAGIAQCQAPPGFAERVWQTYLAERTPGHETSATVAVPTGAVGTDNKTTVRTAAFGTVPVDSTVGATNRDYRSWRRLAGLLPWLTPVALTVVICFCVNWSVTPEVAVVTNAKSLPVLPEPTPTPSIMPQATVVATPTPTQPVEIEKPTPDTDLAVTDLPHDSLAWVERGVDGLWQALPKRATRRVATNPDQKNQDPRAGNDTKLASSWSLLTTTDQQPLARSTQALLAQGSALQQQWQPIQESTLAAFAFLNPEKDVNPAPATH